MDLREFIRLKGGTGTMTCPINAALAESSGCSPATLYMIQLGHKRAGWKLARRIIDATGGAVTDRDLRPDLFGAVAPKAA